MHLIKSLELDTVIKVQFLIQFVKQIFLTNYSTVNVVKKLKKQHNIINVFFYFHTFHKQNSKVCFTEQPMFFWYKVPPMEHQLLSCLNTITTSITMNI